ncbi:meiosis-specific with OB domain-containing protein [Tribolium madens]|uniref:meiosis-specific with OB domain-containing protein n=1 Tax=Tribolium madens TaxID=41895 RepID=UPI001CF763B9|nr:meiosis-specific with OB domain-containing protein [Tribolium madens]
MDICGSSHSSTGLQRVALKDIGPDMDNILIVALIIGKQRPRKFLDKTKETEQYKAVWTFTVRDSPRDYINVTYWGSSEDVCTASDKFYTGDVVEIRNPRINVRKFNETGEQFCPMVTSPYSLTLNEHSTIFPFNGDTFFLTKLLNFPTKPLAGFVPLRDIHNEGANMKERLVDILGAIRSVGNVRTVSTKRGQEMQLREIVIFDHTSGGLKITIWDSDIIARASTWKPRTTILFITDAKVEWSTFLRTYCAGVTSRSIITENPIGQEAATLANYAKNAPLTATDILDQFITELPDPESIQNVMCVQQILTKIRNFQENTLTDPQLTALMFVVITQLDLDGLSPVTRVKCGHCKSRLENMNSVCENSECSSNSKSVDVSFDISVHLSDHTGTLKNCRLSGATAEQVLKCSVQQFMRMTDRQKCELKWKFLMERCAVRIITLMSSKFSPRIVIVSCERANALETAQRIPIC